MKINFASWDSSADREFVVRVDTDLSRLEIRPVEGDSHLHYFFDTEARRLIKNFVLADGERVRTLMNVTLIKKEGVFEPRVRFWKRTKPGSRASKEVVPDTAATRNVKASVDIGDGHAAFWRVIQFIESMIGAPVPSGPLQLVPKSGAELAGLLVGQDRESLLRAMQLTIGEDLTQADINLLTNRRAQLEEFRRLLNEPTFFEEKRQAVRGPEEVWQVFFEKNQWIFGYGLTFLSCEALSGDRLEQVTTGANIFTGGGKRSDAVMRTRGTSAAFSLAKSKHIRQIF